MRFQPHSRICNSLFLFCLATVVPACDTDAQQEQAKLNATSQSAQSPTKTTIAGGIQVKVARTMGEDWATFLGPTGDGKSSETGLDPNIWAPHPKILWTMPLGVSYGGPAIADGRLFQFDRFERTERLTCFEAESAREIWRWESLSDYNDMYGYNSGPRCAPVVDQDRVYTFGVSGQLSCLKVSNGELVWTKDTSLEYSVVQNFFGVASSPCVYENLILVMVGGSPEESHAVPLGQLSLVKPNGSAIVAFDKMTGEEVYRLGDDLASYASLSVRTIDGKPTGLAFCRDNLIGWDPATGKQLFQFPWRSPRLESVNAALPVTSDNRILLSEAYDIGSVLLEIESDTPSVVWKDTGPRNDCSFRAHWSTPVLIDGYLYGCNGRNEPDSDLRCVEFATGKVMWKHRRHERSSVLAVDGYLIVLGEFGNLELIRPTPEKLDVVKEVDLSDVIADDDRPLLSSPCWAAPVLSHGLLYLRGNDHLVCMELIPTN